MHSHLVEKAPLYLPDLKVLEVTMVGRFVIRWHHSRFEVAPKLIIEAWKENLREKPNG